TRFYTSSFNVHGAAYYIYLHSFPTRRSSDLESQEGTARRRKAAMGGDAVHRRRHAHLADAVVDVAAAEIVRRHFLQALGAGVVGDRKSTRLNSSHGSISYAVFCLKKKKY